MFTIIEGDSFKVLPKIDKNSIDLCVTSPPYNVGKEYDVDMTEDEYVEWTLEWMSLVYPTLKDTGVFILNIGDKIIDGCRGIRIPKIWLGAIDIGYNYIELYIWNKGKALPHKSRYRATNIFEYCFWFTKSMNFTFNTDSVRRPYNPISIKRMNYGIRKRFPRKREGMSEEYKEWSPNPLGALPKNILDIGSESKNQGHTAVYPTKLTDWFIQAATNPGDTVLDPFLGSGTTMISAVTLGRNCIGIEIDSTFAEMARARVFNLGCEVNAYVWPDI